MTELEQGLALVAPLALTPGDIVLSLLLALGLSFVVAMVYRFSLGARLAEPSLQLSFVVLAMVGAMVMLVIGDNLARAFSLVGALAIVRFRTRLRSPWDISFVFLALSVGIACGVMVYKVAIIGTAMISLAIVALNVLPIGSVRQPVYALRFDVNAYEDTAARVHEVVDRYASKRWLTEARSLRFGETMSYRYRVVLHKDDQLDALLRAVGDLEGVEQVVLNADLELAGDGT